MKCGPNPYPGPRPFEPNETAKFFGRDREIEQLSDLAQTYPVTLLYGRTGVGKTSLLRAGLPSLLASEGVACAYARLAPRAAAPSILIEVLRETLGLPKEYSGGWLDDLHTASIYGEAETLVLVIDQAEELFLADGRIDPGCKQALHELTRRCIRTDHARLAIIISFREDALASFDDIAVLLPHGTGIRLRLAPLDEDQARLAIVGPVSATIGEERISAEPLNGDVWAESAIHDVLKNVRRSDGSIDALLLQCICANVWRNWAGTSQINDDDVEKFGSIRNTLESFVGDILSDIPKTSGLTPSKILRWIESHLIEGGGA